MSPMMLAAIAVVLCLLFRLLNVNSSPLPASVTCSDHLLRESLHSVAPILAEPYVPTRLWGFSGHMQTIVHNVIGRVKCPWPLGRRITLTLNDGSTLTYDLYDPVGASRDDDVTVAICPGIGNSSESVYIRTFVHFTQYHGYRIAVLNHIGALTSVPVTGNRIFSYGHTDDFSHMVDNLMERFPHTSLVLVGFSLGGNLITKYLGEKNRTRPDSIIGGISICQGYNAIESLKYLLNWQNFRRVYLYVMTDNYRNIITRHKSKLLCDEFKEKYDLCESSIASAATLPDLDDVYTRRVFNFPTVADLYRWSSSINYIENITTPMVFINAKDDPIVPDILLEPIRKLAGERDKMAFIELAHGGHLGFYEGGAFYPNPVTWMDKAIVALIGGLLLSHHKMNPKLISADSKPCVI